MLLGCMRLFSFEVIRMLEVIKLMSEHRLYATRVSRVHEVTTFTRVHGVLCSSERNLGM